MVLLYRQAESPKLPLTGFSPGNEAVFRPCGGPDMARIPDEELQRIKSQVTVEDLCRDYGIELHAHGAGQPHGPLPVPRRPDAELRRHPVEEPVELSRGVRRRRRDRTGRAQAERLLPPGGGHPAAAIGHPARRPDHRDAQRHHAPDARAGLRDRTGRPRAAQARPRLLPPDLPATT